jgi:hypothetical protein
MKNQNFELRFPPWEGDFDPPKSPLKRETLKPASPMKNQNFELRFPPEKGGLGGIDA